MSDSSLLDQVTPVYRDAVRSLMEKSEHSGVLNPAEGSSLMTATIEGYTLGILVDSNTHTISAARFKGEGGTVTAALLEKLCGLIVGLPIVEAYDHGVVKLEFALRGRYGDRPVQGIVLPRNADPMFSLPERLLREVANQYQAESGIKLGDNYFDPGPSGAWVDFSAKERLDRLQSVFAKACEGIPGLDPSMIHITDIEFNVRITIEIDDGDFALGRPEVMRILEAAIHEHLDTRLELVYTVMKDNNTIRRLG
jgi:NifU-like protein involved in Fe-S cluster formation